MLFRSNKVDPASQEFSDDAADIKNSNPPAQQTDEQLAETFKKSAKLQKEFGSAGDYAAFIRADAAGQVSISE